MSDCCFCVSPVNDPDPDPDEAWKKMKGPTKNQDGFPDVLAFQQN